jgi:hypothetical protein
MLLLQTINTDFMKGSRILLLMTVLLPLSIIAKANGRDGGKAEPVIQGFVADATTKKPVQGVTVSISSKGQDKKEFVTDACGNFKVSQMPLGDVIIVLEKKGYKTCRKEGVTIKEGVSLKLNFDLMDSGDDYQGDVFHPLMGMLDGD